MSTTPTDPMEFLKTLWGNTGMPLPGLVTPTLDTNELDKRIADFEEQIEAARKPQQQRFELKPN